MFFWVAQEYSQLLEQQGFTDVCTRYAADREYMACHSCQERLSHPNESMQLDALLVLPACEVGHRHQAARFDAR